MSLSGIGLEDCYFYYYSSCSKGSFCPFRHEPAALAQETVCTFWKQGKCRKPHCIFRHMDLEKKRSTIPCYWESQPTGCRKPHCPFLHETPKDMPLPTIAQLTEAKQAQSTAVHPQKIIVNKNRLGQLNNLILPVQPAAPRPQMAPAVNNNDNDDCSSLGPRVVIAPANDKISAKLRLGKATGSVKDRLGTTSSDSAEKDDSLSDAENYEVLRNSDSDEDPGSELEELRKSAIKTLDLRKRLTKKASSPMPVRLERSKRRKSAELSENETSEQLVKSIVKKVKKESKKKNREKSKNKEKSKKLKKKEKREKKGKSKIKTKKSKKKSKKEFSSGIDSESVDEHEATIDVVSSDENSLEKPLRVQDSNSKKAIIKAKDSNSKKAIMKAKDKVSRERPSVVRRPTNGVAARALTELRQQKTRLMKELGIPESRSILSRNILQDVENESDSLVSETRTVYSIADDPSEKRTTSNGDDANEHHDANVQQHHTESASEVSEGPTYEKVKKVSSGPKYSSLKARLDNCRPPPTGNRKINEITGNELPSKRKRGDDDDDCDDDGDYKSNVEEESEIIPSKKPKEEITENINEKERENDKEITEDVCENTEDLMDNYEDVIEINADVTESIEEISEKVEAHVAAVKGRRKSNRRFSEISNVSSHNTSKDASLFSLGDMEDFLQTTTTTTTTTVTKDASENKSKLNNSAESIDVIKEMDDLINQ